MLNITTTNQDPEADVALDSQERETVGITAVVPTRDRSRLLVDCLQALRASLRSGDELIVVDSASRDAQVEHVARRYGARYIRCELPGASLARNTGWRVATNDLIGFVDDDIRVDPLWASSLAQVFVESPEAAFVTGRIGLPPGPPPERPVAMKLEEEPAWLDSRTTGVLGHSANLAVKRPALESVHGFDETLGAGGRFLSAEDLDLFDRLFAVGLLGRYEPTVSATHEHWRGRRDVLRLEWAYGVGAGARVRKHLRTERRLLLTAARLTYWDAGFLTVARVARNTRRRPYETVGRVLRLVGAFVGFVRAIFVPMREGHLISGHDQLSRLSPR